MTVNIKNKEDIKKMRIAGKLASQVLDYISNFVTPNITTEELDKLCHEYMVNVQETIPAPLNYAPPGHTPFPKSICTSVNNQICHGIPGDKILNDGDVLNIDVTPTVDGWHGDSSRMFYVGEVVFSWQNHRQLQTWVRRSMSYRHHIAYQEQKMA